ncbi:uncharacterized protein METZ01_LOCUS388378 [marine metagenome]|uniref:Uncharacterized protein n=1 Tax=marine metagenome TaxID=408172 RepID=A0A382UMM0_9ZZZZ
MQSAQVFVLAVMLQSPTLWDTYFPKQV